MSNISGGFNTQFAIVLGETTQQILNYFYVIYMTKII